MSSAPQISGDTFWHGWQTHDYASLRRTLQKKDPFLVHALVRPEQGVLLGTFQVPEPKRKHYRIVGEGHLHKSCNEGSYALMRILAESSPSTVAPLTGPLLDEIYGTHRFHKQSMKIRFTRPYPIDGFYNISFTLERMLGHNGNLFSKICVLNSVRGSLLYSADLTHMIY